MRRLRPVAAFDACIGDIASLFGFYLQMIHSMFMMAHPYNSSVNLDIYPSVAEPC
jgi:hypothetical protein